MSEAQIAKLLARSERQIVTAPALILACAIAEGLRTWPDHKRRRAEFRMAVQSVGCAMENIMVAANAEGLASYWISAPLFCPDAVREALDLPDEFEPQALVSIGYPAGDPKPRSEPDLGKLIHSR